jgi:peptidoglycan hydrolase-like amidase
VVARTYALARRSSHPHGRDGFDLCDEQHCQVYAGAAAETAAVRAAVDGTRGEVLSIRGRPAYTAYASNCGGEGRSAREAGWGGASYLGRTFDGKDGAFPASSGAFRDWLLGGPDLFCGASRFVPGCHSRWARVVDAADVTAALRRRRDIGPLKRLEVLRRDAAGRVTLLRATGERGELTLGSESFARQILGRGTLRSDFYALEMQERAGRVVRVFVYGGGWGHGVGLCQGGAAGRAEAGQTHEEILKHYFPGTSSKPRP